MFSKYYEKILQNHIQQRFREALNKLTTALINLKRKFSSRIEKDPQSRRKKQWGEKGENIKGEAFTTEGMLTSRKKKKRAGWRGVLRFKQKQKALKSQVRTRALLINRTRRLSKYQQGKPLISRSTLLSRYKSFCYKSYCCKLFRYKLLGLYLVRVSRCTEQRLYRYYNPDAGITNGTFRWSISHNNKFSNYTCKWYIYRPVFAL